MNVAENHFKSWDGAELFHRFWQSRDNAAKAIVMFHRGHEHSAGWRDVIEKLNLPDISIFAWDARGHGNSPGERGYGKSFGVLVRDADAFVAHVSRTHGIPYENIVIFAQGVGSVMAGTWVHDDAPRMLIEALFADDSRGADLSHADAKQFTWKEYAGLARPLPVWSLKRWIFAVSRLSLNTLGRLSKGIRIGWKTGFDSGAMLDYVYENKARGFSPLGKLIDRLYLNSPGWRGIRQRKRNLEAFLHRAIRDHLDRDDGGEVRILDIAAGHGRYILDVIKDYGPGRVTALLRDYAEVNVRAGRNLAFEMGLSNVTYAQGNAFDRQSLSNIVPRANVAIASGLYELFPDNNLLRQSLAGVAEALEPGGTLIYTNQTWHPQLEFIARVLTSHRRGNAWVMRRRTQQEMDQLVRQAGFEKIAQTIDADGIFSVSMARKTTPTPDENSREKDNDCLPILLSADAEMWAWRTLAL